MRFATLSQNSQNRIKEKGKYKSDYTGVSDCKENSKFRATISYDGKYIHIGRFNTDIEAAKAYDIYAIHYYGIHSKTNNMLTINEIEDIIENGIPVEYQKKTRDLPKCIHKKGNKYAYDIRRGNVRYYKSFDTLEEAVAAKEELLTFLDNEKLKQKDDEIAIKEIDRNKDGIAVIYMRDRNGNIRDNCLVNDHTWKELFYFKWYLKSDGYSAGKVNNISILMHNYLYIKYIGPIPKGYTIDHINNNPLDNRLENLRLADNSLQSHNQKKTDGAICPYKGVTINGNKFVVNPYGTRYSFEYMEDAAKKFNELAIEKYGDDANLNVVDDNKKTRVRDLLPDTITEEFIRSIEFVEMFKQVVKKMGWGGKNGYFNQAKIKIATLDQDKEKAIKLLADIKPEEPNVVYLTLKS